MSVASSTELLRSLGADGGGEISYEVARHVITINTINLRVMIISKWCSCLNLKHDIMLNASRMLATLCVKMTNDEDACTAVQAV